ncbi:MAG: AraC family transcriptional regulator [Clostridia bacterium]|nr:AraC family transcriptional regulator [Clostridia bacterium]
MLIVKTPENNINVERFYTFHHRIKNYKYVFPGDRHTFWELHAVLKGSKVLTCDDKILNLSAGQMYLIPPHEFHQYIITETELEYIVLTFDMDYTPPDVVYSLSDDNIKLMRMMISEMKEKFPNGDFNDNSTTAPQTLKLLTELLISRAVSHDAVPCAKNENSDIFGKAVHFMKANIFDTISSNDIAKHCGVSNSTLKRLFKIHTQNGVMYYYNSLKMEYAKKMIEKGTTVCKIAEELNFSSQAYFSSSFKQYTGMSPLAYKKSI